MNEATITPATETLRPELTPLPDRIRALPVRRGYPVPWFVTWVDGEPEFRIADSKKWSRAVRERLCWVCGQRLGSYLAFVLGPMCGITRTTAEPPLHHECALWSIRNCPFLVRPHMERRSGDLPEGASAPGFAILRNPGVTLLWVTRRFEIFRDHNRRPLLRVGDPVSLEYYQEGLPATRAGLDHSIEGGLPALRGQAVLDGPAAMADLERDVRAFERLLAPGDPR